MPITRRVLQFALVLLPIRENVMPDQTCRCRHDRRLHSKHGCTDFDPKTGKECPCKIPYMEVGKR